MIKKYASIIGILLLMTLTACGTSIESEKTHSKKIQSESFVFHSPSHSMSTNTGGNCGAYGCGLPLTEEQKNILYAHGTEAPFTSTLVDEHRPGTFVAADTGEALFRSEDKFDSGTGWPSFTKPISDNVIIEKQDARYGMVRTEVQTKQGSHLGHVFTDGPKPTGLRYCINGLALRFIPDSAKGE